MIRKALLPLVLLCVFLSASFTVYAEASDCSFILSDVSVKSGRIFTAILNIKSEGDVSAFAGEILFDETMVEYREAKTTDSKSFISVNTNEKGKITFVYLCEDGVPCSSEAEIIKFTFKAKTAGKSDLSLGVRDVIDNFGNDISIGLIENSSVMITGSSGVTDNEGSYNSTSTSEQDFSKSSNTTNVKGGPINLYLVGSAIASVVVALITVAYISYKFGVRKQRVNSDKEAKERKDNEEKT